MDYVLDFPPCGIAADDSNASTSKKLIVRRRGFGSVSFLGMKSSTFSSNFPQNNNDNSVSRLTGPISVRDSTDLADLAERNVKFDHQSIEIYPDHPDHPDHHRNSVPAGQGLNQPAIVTFENVESARKWILIRSQRGIQTHTQSVNLERTGTEFSPGPAKFRHYDASTRTLHFHVPSFSKYSLLPVQDTPRIPLNHNFVDQSSSNNATENANGIPASSMGNGTRNGREMFYAANKSVILVNNGPRRPNPFLEKSSGPSSGKSLGVSNDNDSFRPCPLPSSLVNQNSSPGMDFHYLWRNRPSYCVVSMQVTKFNELHCALRLIDWSMVEQITVQSVNWLFDWLVDCSMCSRLIDWLIDWLFDWTFD